MIEFNRVSKRYADHDALRDVSLTIGTGEMVFLTGHSGAGKTTFLRLLMLLERSSMGTLRVDGRDTARIKGRNIGRYRGEFGIVLMVGGSIHGKTKVIAISIYDHVEQLSFVKAHLLAGGMLIFSFLILLTLYYSNKSLIVRVK